MLEIAASCPRCSRMFVLDCPPDGDVPWHLDPLLGLPCPASGMAMQSYLELASPAHARLHDASEWPRWRAHRRRQGPP